MKFKLDYIILALVLISLLYTGLDFTHHAHNSWFYHEMIENWDYMGQDPYFGSQITYAYGVPAYTLAGLFWFIFGIHSINIIIGLTVIINFIILTKWFKKVKNGDVWICTLTALNLFFTIFDAYVAAFSNCLFWLASYAYFNKKKWWSIPLLIGAFNHPYVLISSLFFAISSPYLIIPLSVIMSYFVIASKLFTKGIFLPIYTIFMGLARIIVNLIPIMVLVSKNKIKLKEFKLFKKISNIKLKIPTLLTVLLISFPIALILTFYTLVYQPNNDIDFSMFEGLPKVNGTIRVIDYLYLPSVFVLPYQGFILEAGSFRENNPQHMIKTNWNNESEYLNFLEEGNISFVLFCKMCNPQSNEYNMLDNYFDLLWENNYYYFYNAT